MIIFPEIYRFFAVYFVPESVRLVIMVWGSIIDDNSNNIFVAVRRLGRTERDEGLFLHITSMAITFAPRQELRRLYPTKDIWSHAMIITF